MNGTAPSKDSKWYTEPIRRISNWVTWIAAAITALLAIGVATDVVDLVPEKYRAQTTAIIAGLGAALTFLHKVQGWLARNGVPGTPFNGMFSPETVHNAMVASAQPGSLASASVSDSGAVIPARIAEVGAMLGQDVDGNHVADPAIPQPPAPVDQPDLDHPPAQ